MSSNKKIVTETGCQKLLTAWKTSHEQLSIPLNKLS